MVPRSSPWEAAYLRWLAFIGCWTLAGLRWGEAAALEREDIEFRAAVIHVQSGPSSDKTGQMKVCKDASVQETECYLHRSKASHSKAAANLDREGQEEARWAGRNSTPTRPFTPQYATASGIGVVSS